MLEKTLESPLDCKEIQPVHSEGDQPWDFFGRNDAKTESPVLWPPHAKSWLIGKDSDAGRDSGQEEKGTTEDEMAGWHHWLDGHESEWTPGVGDGQAWRAAIHGVTKSRTRLSDWTELIISMKNLLFSESHPHVQVLTSLHLATLLVAVSQSLSLGRPDSPLATVAAFNSDSLFCDSPGLHITFYILFHHFSWLSKKSMLR